MEKKDPISGDRAIHYLETAALYPQWRGEMIARALHELLICLPAVGTALVWPCQDRDAPWKVYYAGDHPESMRHWLATRLNFSLDTTLGVLQKDLSKLSDMPLPHLICLQPAPLFPGGLWIVWTPFSPLPREDLGYQKEVRQALEALIEVESSEEHYFSSASPLSDPALIDALAQGDPGALSVFLGFTRLLGNADMTAWGQVYPDSIEIKNQIGAKQDGFEFELPSGHGIGGRLITSGLPILHVEDYLNSPYRDAPSVSDAVDSESLRSIIALPIRARQGEERNGNIGGVLYAARRIVKPFSLAEQLRVQRLTRLLEPIRPPACHSPFRSFGLPSVFSQQAAWYKLVSQTNSIESLEAQISQFIKGTAIVTDSDGYPYVPARSEELKRLQASSNSSIDVVQVISLDLPGISSPGKVYLRGTIALPPSGWSDFFIDLAVGCNLIIERMEQEHNHLARQREQWLQAVLRDKLLLQISKDGYRLGLPFEEGQLWVIAWPSQRVLSKKSARQRMLVENIILDQLKSPLLFLGDDIGVILLDAHTEASPSKLRDALLTQFAPHPLWIVHGARYHSFRDLKIALIHSISQAQKVRREENGEHLLEVQTPGLESLIQYHSLFISYAHQDQTIAERLYNDFRKQDIPCWFAPHELTPGDYYRHKIDEAIKRHDKLVLILSEHSIKSRWVEEEVETALKREESMDMARQVLFPIRLDDAAMTTSRRWISSLRYHRHIGDFTNWQDDAAYQQAFTTLLQHLKVSKSWSSFSRTD